jgi:release factor glutamine methyltransferase
MTQEEEWLLREKYQGRISEMFLADCDRLKAGEPLAYLIGSIPFLNTTIYLDLPDPASSADRRQAGSRPLIPRTETEFWVEQIIHNMTNSYKGKAFARVLDLCAGSGCIGVAVLNNVQNATVDFVEIDGAHHETIRKNILENDIDISRTNIFGGDLFEHVSEKYDYILTNPPYVDPVQNQTDENVKKYEPAQALYADNAGLEIIFKIIAEASRFLTHQGILVIEHDPEQSEAIQAYASLHHLKADTKLDQFGVERFTLAKLFS